MVVSNHGGRVIDTVLPGDRSVAGSRGRGGRACSDPARWRGSTRDRCGEGDRSGAAAVMIGRPYLYALLRSRERKECAACIDILHREIEMAMAACGRPRLV